MSQSGVLDVVSATPTIPTTFVADTGSAVPIANTIEILGGVGISTSASGMTVTISNTAGGFSWNDVTSATQTLAAQNGYVTDNAGGVVYSLPASGTLGDEIRIVGKLGIASISQAAGQQVLLGSSSSTVGAGGSFTATNVGDCIGLICITAGASTVWRADTSVGNWTIV